MAAHAPATIGPGVARALVELAVARGLDPAPLHAFIGSAVELDEPEARIDFAAFARAWAWLSDALHDDTIALELAGRLRIEAYDIMGFACLTAPTGTEALARLVRYQRLFTNAGLLELRQGVDEAELLWLRDGPLDRGHRLIDESVIACSAAHFQQVIGTAPTFSGVWFRHAAPDNTHPYRRFFGGPVQFGASSCGLRFPRAALDVAPRLHNAGLAAHFERIGDAALSHLLGRQTVSARVAETLLRELPSGVPSFAVVARRLAMSERTLRRRLLADGVVYRELVDRVRADRSQALLAEGRSSVSEVAFAVGFADASTFARAFRRWTGRAPREQVCPRGA